MGWKGLEEAEGTARDPGSQCDDVVTESTLLFVGDVLTGLADDSPRLGEEDLPSQELDALWYASAEGTLEAPLGNDHRHRVVCNKCAIEEFQATVPETETDPILPVELALLNGIW